MCDGEWGEDELSLYPGEFEVPRAPAGDWRGGSEAQESPALSDTSEGQSDTRRMTVRQTGGEQGTWRKPQVQAEDRGGRRKKGEVGGKPSVGSGSWGTGQLEKEGMAPVSDTAKEGRRA